MSHSRDSQQISGQFEKDWQRRFAHFANIGKDEASIAGWTQNGLDVRVRNFQRNWIDDPEPGCWLDAGCGAGTYLRLLQGFGADVMGVDYSLPTLNKARGVVLTCSSWLVADVKQLPLPAELFEGVLCFGVLQAVSASGEIIKELRRVTRPGGYVWVDALNGSCLPDQVSRRLRRLRGRPMHLRYEYPENLVGLMREQGLIDIEIQWVPILPGRLQRWQPMLETPRMRRFLRNWPLLASWMSHAFAVRGRRPSVAGGQ